MTTKFISEKIEKEALISLHEHCPEDTKQALGLHIIEVADGVIAAAEHDPSILINRTLGLGVNEPLDPASLTKVVETYKKLGIENYFLHLYDEDLGDIDPENMGAFGLEPTRGWMKFARGTEPATPKETDLRIEVVGKDKATDFGTIVCDAFGMKEESVPLLAGLANDPRWYLFVSYDGDQPAGAGSLFVDDNVGWLEWGATSKAFRCRGSQGAIMSARITKALELGCTAIFTETGEEVQGDPQHSYKNIQKAGFKESQLRRNYRLVAGG